MPQPLDYGPNDACFYITCYNRLSTKHKCLFQCTVFLPLNILVSMLILYATATYPEFSVDQFYVSAFNKTSSNTTSSTISFDIKLLNQNKLIELYYDGPVDVTFSFIPRETNDKIIWKYSVPMFYQGFSQSKRLIDIIKPLEAPDTPVFNQTAVAEHSSVLPFGAITTGLEPLLYFRVDFLTKVRFNFIGKQPVKDFAVSANVPIGATTGEKFAEEGIQASAGSRIGCGGTQSAVMVVLTAYLIIFM